LIGIQDWVQDLLVSRGALVESEEGGGIRAMLPEEVAAKLGAGEWLSLDFRPRPGGDDPAEWMERMERLLPPGLLVASAQVRNPVPATQVDAEAALSSELAIQNGIWRLIGISPGTATYLFYTFEYTVESDDRSLGLVTACFNADARSVVSLPESFLRGVRERLEETAPAADRDTLARFFPAAATAAQAEIRKHAARNEESANRRLARDIERVSAYYEGLLAQIEKRIGRCANDAAAVEKERSRAQATVADRAAKLEDLRRKYSLRIQADLAAVLVVRAPVSQISLRMIRKREERQRVLHWSPVLRALESPVCEHCLARAHPLYLCERMHILCRACWAQCPGCARFFCRACQPHCKCAAV